jgi:hypothetical protein
MLKFPKYLDTYSFGVCRDCEPGVNQHPPTHHATTYSLATSSHQVPLPSKVATTYNPYLLIYDTLTTLAALILIIIFSKMLKISKVVVVFLFILFYFILF